MDFPKVFLSGPTEVEPVFNLLAPALAAKGITAVRMPFPAQPLDPARVSLRELSACQAMVLVLRSRYGTPWAELGNKSITEHEFLEAITRQIPLFCYIDNKSEPESALSEFEKRIRTSTQKTLVYEEGDLSDAKRAAERIIAAVTTFRWVPPAFTSFGEWENMLLAQYSRVTHKNVDRNSYPPAMGRNAEQAEFLSWLKEVDPKKNTALISGMPGFGKTLFTYHSARAALESEGLGHPDLLVIPPGAEFDLQSLRSIVPDPKSAAPLMLIIDDADERGDLPALMKMLASMPHFGRMKIILTCQAGSVGALYIRGFPLVSKTHSAEIQLKPIELPELQSFRNARRLNVDDPTLVSLRKITGGIPLYLDLYLNLGRQLGTISNQADMEEHFVLERLGDVVTHQNELALLKILALVGSISLQHPLTKHLLDLFGVPNGEVEALAEALVRRCLIYKVGSRHRVTDRLIQDFVLARYWTGPQDRERILPILGAAGELAAGILEGLARAEWAQAKIGAKDKPFQDIWAAIEVAFSKSVDSTSRSDTLELLKDAAYFLPDLALKLADLTRKRQLEAISLNESLPARELEAASDLSYALGHWPEHFEIAIDILWDLGKRDSRRLNAFPSHGHRHLESLAKLKPGAPLGHYDVLLDHIERWLKEALITPWQHSPIDVLDAVLEWEWSKEYYYKGAFTLQRGEIPHSPELETLRIRAVNILGDCLVGAYGTLPMADALHKLRSQLPIYQHPGWNKVGEATISQLRRASEHYLARHEVAIPYLIFQRIDDLLDIFEKNEKFDKASEDLRSSIWTKLESEYPREIGILQATVYTRFGGSEADDLKRAQEVLVSLGPVRAQQLLEDLQSQLAPLDVELKIAVLSAALTDDWKKFSPALYEEIIQKSSNPRIVGHSISLLWDSRLRAEKDPEVKKSYLSLLSRFPELRPQDRPEISAAVKGYVRWFIQMLLGSKQVHLLPEEVSLIREWRSTPDIAWSLIVKHVADQDAELARDLILSAQPGSDRKAADEVCSALISSKGVLATFTDEHWKNLLGTLEETGSLDDYWTEQAIIFASNRFPRQVAAFLLRRLKRQEENPGHLSEYHALPWGVGDRFSKAFVEADPTIRRELVDEAISMIVAADRGDRYFLYQYANLVAGRFIAGSGDVLRDRAMSGKPEEVEALAGIIQHSYPNFIFDHPDVVEGLLKAASNIGAETVRHVSSALFAGAGSRSYSRAIGQPSQVHVQLRDSAQCMKQKFLPGTPTYELFAAIEKSADADIKREQLEDEETLDE